MNQPTDPRTPSEPASPVTPGSGPEHPVSRSAEAPRHDSGISDAPSAPVPAGSAEPAPSHPAPSQPSPSQPAPSAERYTGTQTTGAQVPVSEEKRGGGRTAALWVSLILGAIVLILLLIFVIQNNVSAQFQYFGAQFTLPLGVAMLLAAIAGALVMALVGSVRIMQLSWTLRKLRRNEKRIRASLGG